MLTWSWILVCLPGINCFVQPVRCDGADLTCAQASMQYLRNVMDEFHGEQFYVYYDADSPHNHFFVWQTYLSTHATVTFNGQETEHTAVGVTSIRFEFQYDKKDDWASMCLQNGVWLEDEGILRPNWGDVSGAGLDLTGATSLHFQARGANGGEILQFFVGGVGRDPVTGKPQPDTPYPGSTAKVYCLEEGHFWPSFIILTKEWQSYTIDLTGCDLSHLICGFGWETSALYEKDTDGVVVFYVDDIHFQLNETKTTERLEEPRLLRSFTTRPQQHQESPNQDIQRFDHIHRNVALVYDNALALLAFLAENTVDGIRRARLIGDAFLYAADRDRAFTDGRLRSAYSAGDLKLPPGWKPNGIEGEVRFAGFYGLGDPNDPNTVGYHEMFASNISMGNTAWAMLALLALYERTNNPKYLNAADDLGNFIRTVRDETVSEYTCPQRGFPGGLDAIEDVNGPKHEHFYSAEHNIDIYAAFRLMHELTADPKWLEDANDAKALVYSLWDESVQGFRAGLDEKCGLNVNMDQLPLDVQAWVVLGIPGTLEMFPDVLVCPEEHHRTTCTIPDDKLPSRLQTGTGLILEGYDFNNDTDGIWLEGTAHMATAYAWAGDINQAQTLCDVLNTAQQVLPFHRSELPEPYQQPYGLVAACSDGTTTGFGFVLMQRLHIGATAWNVFAQLGFNPFDQGTKGVMP
jgi:hypothetical protein